MPEDGSTFLPVVMKYGFVIGFACIISGAISYSLSLTDPILSMGLIIGGLASLAYWAAGRHVYLKARRRKPVDGKEPEGQSDKH